MDSSKIQLCKEGIVKVDDYFNAGVLLINLNHFHNEESKIWNGIEFIGKNSRYTLFDQDVLNYCFSKQVLKLPVKFNYFIKSHRSLKENVRPKRIYHYTYSIGGIGLTLDMNDSLNRLWTEYFIKTPFFDADSIGRLYNGFRNMQIGLKNFMIQVSAVMSGKTRAFFAAPNNRDAVKKFFSVRDDEEIILAENQESLKKLLDAMKKTRDRKVFFIMLPNFPFNLLMQAGFQPGRDFVNGFDFLSEAHGIPLNSYQLIKAM